MSAEKNRINALFERKSSRILSVYFTAGFPQRDDTLAICRALQTAGADLIEIGFPFSDPLADGETIQRSSERALKNGMSLKLLFEQLAEVRQNVKIPLILMGYINPVLQFGVDRFVEHCVRCGIDGVILPDLPLREYLGLYRSKFEQAQLRFISLITPQTSEDRIREIDRLSDGFIYAVSAAAITGTALAIGEEREKYLRQLKSYKLKNPLLLGFGIKDHQTYLKACEYVSGVVIGSAYLNAIQNTPDLTGQTAAFVRSILEERP